MSINCIVECKMGRCSVKGLQCQGLRRGAWTQEEDNLLRKCIEKYGTGKWRHVPKRAGLNRCRKSCRLRWLNYLSPGIKRGRFDADEDDLIIRLHKLVGNRWSLIAGRIPGRTGNDVKNYWNSHLSKRLGADYKTRGVSDATVMRPQPQTIPMDHRWSKDGISSEAKHQEVKSESPIPPPAINNPTTIANDLNICDGSKQATSHVGFMALELDANPRIDGNGGTGNCDLFLGGLGGWEDFLFDLNMWDDLGLLYCSRVPDIADNVDSVD